MKKWAFQRVKCLRYELVEVYENVIHTIPGYVKNVVNFISFLVILVFRPLTAGQMFFLLVLLA